MRIGDGLVTQPRETIEGYLVRLLDEWSVAKVFEVCVVIRDPELLFNTFRVELDAWLVFPTGTTDQRICLNGFGFRDEMNCVRARGEIVDVRDVNFDEPER